MSPRGKKTTPSHLKLVAGTFRKDRSSKHDPKPECAIPLMPPELCDDAKLEWAQKSVELHKLGLLTNIDGAVLAAYCSAYGRWVRAERLLRKIADGVDGLLTRTAKGNIIQNPLIGIANKAANDMMRFATEFGTTPSSRARVNAPPPPGNDPAEKYFTRD
jgi:P27 family predicted phage terminase small subunit